MSFIDVGIPRVIGLILLIRPQVMFGEAASESGKVRALRIVGALLTLVAGIYLSIKVVAA